MNNSRDPMRAPDNGSRPSAPLRDEALHASPRPPAFLRSGHPLWSLGTVACLLLAGNRMGAEGLGYILGPEVDDVSWTPGLSPGAAEAELDDLSVVRRGYLQIPYVSWPVDYAADHLADLYRATGLRIGTAYTMLFQGLSGGPPERYGAAGDFDLMTSWTLVGRDTENPGRLVFDIEDRFAIGSTTPNSLGAQAGTLQPTANTFNDRGWVVRDVYWAQRLYDGQFRFLVGRGDPTDFFGSTWLQSANISFVNRMFSANPTIAGPGHGPTAGVSFRPKDQEFYATAGTANAYGTTTTSGFSTLDQWTFFSFGEVGWTPTFARLGQGRYTVSGWHVGERDQTGVPAGNGVSVVADQQINERIQFSARYGYADAISNIKQYIQGGFGFRGLMGDPDDMAGIAFSVGFPRDDAAQEEKVLEGFYRWQLTHFSQVSVGAQAIFDPGNAPTQEVIGAFWGRFRLAF